jgi:hypothetical protein
VFDGIHLLNFEITERYGQHKYNNNVNVLSIIVFFSLNFSLCCNKMCITAKTVSSWIYVVIVCMNMASFERLIMFQ